MIPYRERRIEDQRHELEKVKKQNLYLNNLILYYQREQKSGPVTDKKQ
jgi:hypothetical protein